MDFARVLSAAEELQRFLESQRWKFCFIGGLAVQRWGAPRFTQDVDLTILTGFGEEEHFIDRLLQYLEGRRPDARAFSLSKRVLLGRTPSGVDADVALGAFPFEERSIARSTNWEFEPARFLRTCSAEDLLIHKVFAGRDRDWADAETILARQNDALNLFLVKSELEPLLELKEEQESLTRLDKLIQRVRRRRA